MPILKCHVCDRHPEEKARYGTTGFANGVYCPVCQRPTCTHHLTTVRWRWKNDSRQTDSARICRECRRTYRHRDWDIHNREWIS